MCDVTFTEPLTTQSPSATSRGRDSPVRARVSRELAPFCHRAVEGHFFAGIDRYDLAHLHLGGIHRDRLSVPQYVCAVRTDVHERGNGFARFARSVFLEKLAHLIEEQHRARFVEALDVLSARARVYCKRERAESGDAHEEVFVQHLTVQDVPRRAPQHVIAYCEINDEIEREGQQPAVSSADSAGESAVQRLVRDQHDEERRHAYGYADEIILFFARHITFSYTRTTQSGSTLRHLFTASATISSKRSSSASSVIR